MYFRTAGTTTSNAVTVAVSANGAPCSEPSNPLAQTFIQGGKAGTMRLIRSSVREDVATIASTDVSTDLFTYDLSQLQAGNFVFSPLFSQPPAGSCTLFEIAGDYWGLNGGFSIPTTAVRRPDAGTFSISGATNANLAPAASGFPGRVLRIVRLVVFSESTGAQPIEPVTRYAPAPFVITGSNTPDAIPEQLVSNLLPVIELPTIVQVAETVLRKKEDIKILTAMTCLPSS